MSETQPKIAIRTTSEPLTSKFEVMFDKPVECPAEHQEELYIMRQAKDGDLVNMRINTDGGRMSTVSAVQGIINKSDAHFHAILEGDASSAGSMIFLLGHSQEVYPLGSMYIHTCQSGMMGHAQEMGSYGKYIEEYSSNVLDFVYRDFLTEEELTRVKTGGVVWLKAPEIEERLEKRQSIRERETIDEAKETYTPEFYAESVFNDIMEDCQGFEYDVEDIIRLLSDKLDKALVTKEETLCEGCLDCEDITDDDGVFVQFFPNEENPVYSLYFNKAGEVWDGDTEPFESFLVEVDSFTRQDLKMYADTLGVTYAHNTKKETLATNLDIKVKEIVDSLNEE